MALEIPYSEIRDLQISLRKESGLLFNYDPDDPSIPELPSLCRAIPELDPSPDSHLRCSRCEARLLRGVSSVICVFCGGRPNVVDVPPESLKFLSTFGCRWLLQSLHLDGSELVEPLVGVGDSNRGQNTQQSAVPLSSLLDLEIRWPPVPEDIDTSVSEKTPAQKLSTLSLSGVDLDDFFVERKLEPPLISSEDQHAANKSNDATGNDAFEGQGNLSLFENVQSSHTVGSSKEEESGDSFSGWEAEFQSASGNQHPESKLSGPFAGSSSVDLSVHIDSVFGAGKDLFDGKTNENSSSESNADDWFKGDPRSNSNMGVTGQIEKFNILGSDNNGGKGGNTNDSSSKNVDLFQDNMWQSTSSSKAAINNFDEDDDSFDTWNDFTSSTSVNDSSKQDVNHTIPPVDQSSEKNFLGRSNNSQGVDLGSISQSDFFSGTFDNESGSSEVNTWQPETSISESLAAANQRDGMVSKEVEKLDDVSDGDTRLKRDDAEMLMSQMHDLSFMLDSNLSVPHKSDPQKIDPF